MRVRFRIVLDMVAVTIMVELVVGISVKSG